MALLLRSDMRAAAGPARAADGPALRIVIAGNGMAGHRLCARLADAGSRVPFEITVLAEEPVPAYDRIHLTECFSRRAPDDLALSPPAWYAGNGIRLHLGDPIIAIDAEAHRVRTRQGRDFGYDRLVLATGSRPFVPPIPGAGLPGVFVYRTLSDLQAILARTSPGEPAVVLGGGLLGLEAARALLDRNMRVTVLENSLCLLSRQLNPRAARLVQLRLESQGMDIRLETSLTAIAEAPGGGLRCSLSDGSGLSARMVILAAGTRPRDELAAGCGAALGPRGGFLVDDSLRTTVPDIYAVGECAAHRGRTYGLAAPGFRMAECLAASLRGEPTPFEGADQSTTLKVMGVEVHVLGEPLAEGLDVVQETGEAYRQITLRQGRLVGAVAVGAWEEAEFVREAAGKRKRLWRWQLRRFRRGGPLRSTAAGGDPAVWSGATLVCHCNRVDKRAICAAIAAGCDRAESIRAATGASAVCGGCLPVVQRLLGAPAAAEPSRALPTLALAAVLALSAFPMVPAIPAAPSVQAPMHRLEFLWRDSAWHQATGFTVLALAAASLIFPLRKRLPLLKRLGSVPGFRIAHIALALTAACALAVHTGLRMGHGMNLALSACFIGLNLAGAAASGVFAWLERRPSGTAFAFRSLLTWAHILLFWPLPILILFHVWAVYRF